MKYKILNRSAALICAVLIALSAASCRKIDEPDIPKSDIDSTVLPSDDTTAGEALAETTGDGETSEDTAASHLEESTDEENEETSEKQTDTEKTVQTKAPEGGETSAEPAVTTDASTERPTEDKYSDNVFLISKNIGGCTSLTDNILITFVFLNDSESSWDAASRNSTKTALNNEIAKIKRDASTYGVSLSISSDYKNASVSSSTGRGSSTDGWEQDACTSAGLSYSANLNWNIANSRNNIYSAPVIFLLNKEGRSYATSSVSVTAFEYVVIYDDPEALRHELYHLYGARDYYYTTEIERLAEKHFGECIMLDSESDNVDPLTAYLIGWTETPNSTASAFLDSTSHFTVEYIENAHENNTFTGNGTVTFSNRTYTGDMVDGMPHGYGKEVFNSGDVYEGEFEYNLYDGKGTYTWDDGDSYSGEWKDSMKHGQGVFTWHNGDKYEGGFVDDEREGYGVFTRADGSIYTGNWLDGDRSGQGSMTWASGSSYTGEWANNALNGYGTYIWADGSSYTGYWKDNLMHGEGTMTYPNGAKLTGTWENDKFIG